MLWDKRKICEDCKKSSARDLCYSCWYDRQKQYDKEDEEIRRNKTERTIKKSIEISNKSIKIQKVIQHYFDLFEWGGFDKDMRVRQITQAIIKILEEDS